MSLSHRLWTNPYFLLFQLRRPRGQARPPQRPRAEASRPHQGKLHRTERCHPYHAGGQVIKGPDSQEGVRVHQVGEKLDACNSVCKGKRFNLRVFFPSFNWISYVRLLVEVIINRHLRPSLQLILMNVLFLSQLHASQELQPPERHWRSGEAKRASGGSNQVSSCHGYF